MRPHQGLKSTFDFLPGVMVAGFLVFGVLMVYNASSAQALISFDDKFFFLKEQIKWVVVGSGIGIFTFFFDYRRLKDLAIPILVGSLVLLIAVFIPGISVKAYGAHRWINLGFTVLQPSEIAKFSMIIYLSAWLSSKEKSRLLSFLLLISLIVGLVMLEPDMGTAIILLGSAFVVYFLSEKDIKGILLLAPLGILGMIGLAMRSPYRLRRVLTFLDPNSDPLGASYHMRQALIAIGSGGLLGIGLGNSRQKYSYLPEANTDSIFAIIGEELGFVGTLLLVSAFMFFLYRCLQNTIKVEDLFGRTLGLSIIAWIALQTFINISSMVGLTPLTGVPLPFISYGGSALVIELAAIGTLFNIWKQNLK